MAYVLGFWYADGNMRHEKSYRVRFSSNDGNHLIEVRNLMSSNSPLMWESKGICQTFAVMSKKLYFDLRKLGGRPAKSNILSFPKMPEKYIRDFIRGYFDGDGSVHKITFKATKNGKYYTLIRSNFTCGSKNFLESLSYTLHFMEGFPKKRVWQYGEHQFKLAYSQADTFKLLQYMYYEGHVGSLKRKAVYVNSITK